MKKILIGIAVMMALSGCGPSQKSLRTVNAYLEKSKTADCATIHEYLNAIQVELQKKIK